MISDPFTDVSAASLNVNVGSMDNPPNMQGLAHFLGIYSILIKEHMLFKGSDKYPDETYFTSIVQGNGGRFNAYTG